MPEAVAIERPRRWDRPFDPAMDETRVERVLSVPPFSGIDESAFPPSLPLRGIVANDTRVLEFRRGDIIVRAGDYGNSAFVIIEGSAEVVLGAGLPSSVLGRTPERRRGVLGALLAQVRRPRYPEVRDPGRYGRGADTGTRSRGDDTRVYIKDFERLLEKYPTATMAPGEMFGEIAAIGRSQRTATVVANEDSVLIEVRWQALRDMRRYADAFRREVDQLYRERSLAAHLRSTPLFAHLDDETLQKVADRTLFETYGDFDWHTSYKRVAEESHDQRLSVEPVIVAEGDYPDGLLLVRAGFARVTKVVNHGFQTLRCIGRGGLFGLDEAYHNWRTGDSVTLRCGLRAIGYADVLRVPTTIVEELVLPTLPEQALHRYSVGHQEGEAQVPSGLLEFMVENRVINGTATMLIDLDRCVRCDECVVACAKAHGNNPRFNRHGRRHDRFMVANACMHCSDPVCMIGCPTGAIHRSASGGQVVINDDTCIGCATCANACPYDNIRMVEVRDASGSFILDEATKAPIVKATKCDLCFDQPGGPACRRACPHDALERMDMMNLPRLAEWLRR